ncbi:hypothetical protein B0H67DRAFT_556338 [Lasiosphaeris hirsuta]|uniref:Uncharacterized protein n=1 Tax=Lasiosphaeris hirsuta TaxID=260670 RepID=A0AA40A1Q3_9PEZI|nr:hypothetical protein B0H67DRAFT_556338 [Lasiosphaeris hirsuta]
MESQSLNSGSGRLPDLKDHRKLTLDTRLSLGPLPKSWLCKLVPPCKQGRHGPKFSPLASEGRAINLLGKYHLTEEGLIHDLRALHKGAIYTRDEFLKRARAWYKAEIDRLLHLDKVREEAKEEREERNRTVLETAGDLLDAKKVVDEAKEAEEQAKKAEEKKLNINVKQASVVEEDETTPGPTQKRGKRATGQAPTRIQPPRAAKRKAVEPTPEPPKRAPKKTKAKTGTPIPINEVTPTALAPEPTPVPELAPITEESVLSSLSSEPTATPSPERQHPPPPIPNETGSSTLPSAPTDTPTSEPSEAAPSPAPILLPSVRPISSSTATAPKLFSPPFTPTSPKYSPSLLHRPSLFPADHPKPPETKGAYQLLAYDFASFKVDNPPQVGTGFTPRLGDGGRAGSPSAYEPGGWLSMGTPSDAAKFVTRVQSAVDAKVTKLVWARKEREEAGEMGVVKCGLGESYVISVDFEPATRISPDMAAPVGTGRGWTPVNLEAKMMQTVEEGEGERGEGERGEGERGEGEREEGAKVEGPGEEDREGGEVGKDVVVEVGEENIGNEQDRKGDNEKDRKETERAATEHDLELEREFFGLGSNEELDSQELDNEGLDNQEPDSEEPGSEELDNGNDVGLLSELPSPSPSPEHCKKITKEDTSGILPITHSSEASSSSTTLDEKKMANGETKAPEAEMDLSPTLGRWATDSGKTKTATVIFEDLASDPVEISGLAFAVDICASETGDAKDALILML